MLVKAETFFRYGDCDRGVRHEMISQMIPVTAGYSSIAACY